MPEFRLFGSRGDARKTPGPDSDWDILVKLPTDSPLLATICEQADVFLEGDLAARVRASSAISDALEAEFGDAALRSSARRAFGIPPEVPDYQIDLWIYVPEGQLFALRLAWHNTDIEIISGVMGLGYDGFTRRDDTEFYPAISELLALN